MTHRCTRQLGRFIKEYIPLAVHNSFKNALPLHYPAERRALPAFYHSHLISLVCDYTFNRIDQPRVSSYELVEFKFQRSPLIRGNINPVSSRNDRLLPLRHPVTTETHTMIFFANRSKYACSEMRHV